MCFRGFSQCKQGGTQSVKIVVYLTLRYTKLIRSIGRQPVVDLHTIHLRIRESHVHKIKLETHKFVVMLSNKLRSVALN